MEKTERMKLIADAKRLAGYGENQKLSLEAVREIARAMKALQETRR